MTFYDSHYVQPYELTIPGVYKLACCNGIQLTFSVSTLSLQVLLLLLALLVGGSKPCKYNVLC